MENDDGQRVDLYVPRKCSATNKIIAAKDHASVQMNIGQVDDEGKYTGEFFTFNLSGHMRRKGEADACMNRLLYEKGLLTFAK